MVITFSFFVSKTLRGPCTDINYRMNRYMFVTVQPRTSSWHIGPMTLAGCYTFFSQKYAADQIKKCKISCTEKDGNVTMHKLTWLGGICFPLRRSNRTVPKLKITLSGVTLPKRDIEICYWNILAIKKLYKKITIQAKNNSMHCQPIKRLSCLLSHNLKSFSQEVLYFIRFLFSFFFFFF